MSTFSSKYESNSIKLIKILGALNDCFLNKSIKLPKNFNLIIRKTNKYIKPYSHLIKQYFTLNTIVSCNIDKDYLERLKATSENEYNQTNKFNIKNIIEIINKNTYEMKKNNYLLEDNASSLVNKDESIVIIASTLKEWIINLFICIYHLLNNPNLVNKNNDIAVSMSLNVLKELSIIPSKTIIETLLSKKNINSSILYSLSDYFLLIGNETFFKEYYNEIVFNSRNKHLSYKFLIILKKIHIKFYNNTNTWNIKAKLELDDINKVDETFNNKNKNDSIICNLIEKQNLNNNNNIVEDNSNNNINNNYYYLIDNFNNIFNEVISIIQNNMNSNLDISSKDPNTNYFYNLFSKKKNIVIKELDGSNIIDFFTILNTCEEYSYAHLNSITCYSIVYELLCFLYKEIKTLKNQNINNQNNNNISSSIDSNNIFINNKNKDLTTENLIDANNLSEYNQTINKQSLVNYLISNKESSNKIKNNNFIIKSMFPIILSYCIRIFDQSENYLESNKHMNTVEKHQDFNMTLIEASVLESLKIINLICSLDTTIVSTINMRIMQVYERIALKQSGLVFLEILQFFINNNHLMILDLDHYISLFFKIKLKFNYKYEMLSFATLEFLYMNKDIINQITSVFTVYFPLILKIFATFPKFVNSKYFCLIDYITNKNTIYELFNYILDLPSVLLIIENFECFLSIYSSNNSKLNYDEILNEEYIDLINFLIRDENIGRENIKNIPSILAYNKQLETLFNCLITTTRVISTTNIVPKIMDRFLDVVIQIDDIESAIEAILLIFERFSYFNENKHYIQEIRCLLLKKLEKIFKKWNKIIKELEDNIINEIKTNFLNVTKRELICLLCWALGEYLKSEDYINIEYENNAVSNNYYAKEFGIINTFETLMKLLKDNVNNFTIKVSNDNELNILETKHFNDSNTSLSHILDFYSNYFIENTTQEEILNERILNVLIHSLCKLAIKFKNFITKTIQCFQEIKLNLKNENLINDIDEMLVCLTHVSLSTEYMINN